MRKFLYGEVRADQKDCATLPIRKKLVMSKPTTKKNKGARNSAPAIVGMTVVTAPTVIDVQVVEVKPENGLIQVPPQAEVPPVSVPVVVTATPVSGIESTPTPATSAGTNMGQIANCTLRDVMTATPEAPVWHRQFDKVNKIILTDDSFALNRWDVKTSELLLPNGGKSGVYVFTGSDDGGRIGVPFEDSYCPFTNADTRNMLEAVLEGLAALGVHPEIVTSGSVRNRSCTFVTIRIPEHEGFVIDGREFKTYMSALNGFAKNSPFTFSNSNTCVCCANTYDAVLSDVSGAFRFAVYHKKNMRDIIKEVQKLIPAAFDTSIKQHDEFSQHLKHFSAFPISLEDCEKVFAWFIGTETAEGITTRSANIIERLKTLFLRGKGNKGETAFDLFQACTEFYTHESAGESEDPTKQFETSMLGAGNAKKNAFYSALLEMTRSKEKFTAVGHIGNTLLTAYGAKCKAKIEAKIARLRAGK